MLLKPEPTEYNPYFHGYIDPMPEKGIMAFMEQQLTEFPAFIHSLPEEKHDYRYAPGKWSIKEMINHINDTEQIFAYRILAIIRGEKKDIPGFDENEYANNADVSHLSMPMILEEFEHLRKSNLLFFSHLKDECWNCSGAASGHATSARSLAYMIAGHLHHHSNIIKERYL